MNSSESHDFSHILTKQPKLTVKLTHFFNFLVYLHIWYFGHFHISHQIIQSIWLLFSSRTSKIMPNLNSIWPISFLSTICVFIFPHLFTLSAQRLVDIFVRTAPHWAERCIRGSLWYKRTIRRWRNSHQPSFCNTLWNLTVGSKPTSLWPMPLLVSLLPPSLRFFWPFQWSIRTCRMLDNRCTTKSTSAR